MYFFHHFRFQTTQPSQFAGVPQNVFIAKSQGDNLRPQRPGIPIMSNKTLVNKAPPNVKVLQNRGSIHFNNVYIKTTCFQLCLVSFP